VDLGRKKLVQILNPVFVWLKDQTFLCLVERSKEEVYRWLQVDSMHVIFVFLPKMEERVFYFNIMTKYSYLYYISSFI